jgi:tetratricopeptide (TPR) repeat protein
VPEIDDEIGSEIFGEMNRLNRFMLLPLLLVLLGLLPISTDAQPLPTETSGDARPPTAREAFENGLRLRNENAVEARIWFDTALSLDSSNVEVWWRRGRLRGCRLNDPNGGLRDINEALRREPNSIDALCARGHLLAAHLKKKVLAETDFVRAVHLCRDQPEKYPDVIWDVISEVDETRVMAELDDVLAGRHPPGYAWFARGRMHQAAARYDAARDDFERAVAVLPDDTRPYLQLGLTHERRGDTDQALATYTEALRRFPKDRELRLYRLWILSSLKRWAASLDDCDVVLSLDSSALYIHYWRAEAFLGLNRETEAIEALNAIDANDTVYQGTRTLIAELLLKRFFEARRDADFLAVYWKAPAQGLLFAKVLARSAGGYVMAQLLFIIALVGTTLLSIPLLIRRPPGFRVLAFAIGGAAAIALMETLTLRLTGSEIAWSDRFLIAGSAFGNACVAAAGCGLVALSFSRPRHLFAVTSAGVGLMIAWTALLFYSVPLTISPFIRDLAERMPAGSAATLLDVAGRPLAAILVALAAAMREELLCRGLLLPLCYGIIARAGAGPFATGGSIKVAPWTLASLAVGSLWAVVHAGMVEPEWLKFTQILGLSIVLGEVMRREGVVACLMTHGLFNLLAILTGIASEQ